MKKILLIVLIVSIHLSGMTLRPQATPGERCVARPIPHTANAACAESAYPALDSILSVLMDEVVDSLIDEFAPGELNEKEKELDKAHPLAAVRVAWARDTANAVTEGLFGASWKTENTRENAFRHCLWNALMAYSIGPDLARQFGDAHEFGMMEKYPENTKMDLRNNEIAEAYEAIKSRLAPSRVPKDRDLSTKPWCRFVNEGNVFVSWDGDVVPCMGLLHSSYTNLYGTHRKVMRHSYGNVYKENLYDIWRKPDFTDFRERVRNWDFSPCILCGGCSNREENKEDCIGNQEPTCGACIWAFNVASCP